MKLDPIILIIVVILAVYIGLNINNEQSSTISSDENKTLEAKNIKNEKSINRKVISKEEQQKEFMIFYNNIYKTVHSFEKIDSSTKKLANNKPTRLQQYEYFTQLKDVMEKGQMLPLGYPDVFSKSQTKIFETITNDLRSTFQYRKFAYENYLKYLNTGDLEKFSTSKEWLSSAQGSLQSVIINLESLKMKLDIK